MKKHGNTYIFESIDLIISHLLNSENSESDSLNEAQWVTFESKIKAEAKRIQKSVTRQLFSMTKQSRKDLLINQYHSTLNHLQNQLLAFKHSKALPLDNSSRIIVLLESCLQDILSYIESRYYTHLSMDELVSSAHLKVILKKFKKRLQQLSKKLTKSEFNNPVRRLVLRRLFRFVNTDCYPIQITYRDVKYKEALLKGLEELKSDQAHTEIFDSMDRLLIYLNFNSKNYIQLLLAKFETNVRGLQTPAEKFKTLQYYYKAFKQIHPKPRMILNPGYANLETIITGWIKEELSFLKETEPLTLQTASSNSVNTTADHSKVICNLSSDQIALILRAADESRLLQARSMSQVFKSIVPHLSTPNKTELSYNAVRNKTYHVEERDKNIAIERLERMIGKIREF